MAASIDETMNVTATKSNDSFSEGSHKAVGEIINPASDDTIPREQGRIDLMHDHKVKHTVCEKTRRAARRAARQQQPEVTRASGGRSRKKKAASKTTHDSMRTDCTDTSHDKEAGKNDIPHLTDGRSKPKLKSKSKQASMDSCKTRMTRKKAPMKTALDVKNRIIWDISLDKNLFSLGYDDRFVGIVEKNFSAFNWADYCSLSHLETAIPQHRIEFFKYRGTIVWQKSTRMDDVFGSTGGRTIDVVKPIIDARVNLKQAGKASIAEISKKLESYPVQSTRNKAKRSNGNEERPNCFISIRINDPNIVKVAEAIKEDVITFDSRLSVSAIQSDRYHITLLALRVASDEDRSSASLALKQAGIVFCTYFPSGSSMNLQGVGCFRSRVLHATPNDIDAIALKRFQRTVREIFIRVGLKPIGEHGIFNPHMTLLKFNREMSRNIGQLIELSLRKYGPTTTFGSQKLDGIDLCYMGEGSADDGFYSPVCPRVDITNYIGPAKGWHELESTLCEAGIYESHRIVAIMRGLPGSGKSTVAKHLASKFREKAVIVSADDYFTCDSGEYTFEETQLSNAHDWCFEKFCTGLTTSASCIIVDNTNISSREWQRYQSAALDRGFSIVMIETITASLEDLKLNHNRGLHSVPFEKLVGIFKAWEPSTLSTTFPVDMRDRSVPASTFSRKLEPATN